MPRDIGEWLDGLGLGQYTEAFADNEIDFQALPHLTDADLKEIGVALGARRKLIAAISKLADLDAPATLSGNSDHPSAPTEAERRHLTVMFCDLIGSTGLAERLEAETYRDVLRGYQEACAGAVAAFDGHVAKYIGDGVLAYFGYPRAHEDDAARAVHAGRGILHAIASFNTRLNKEHGLKLQTRIGIHTGAVVAGEMGGGATREAHAIVGETPNIAARLEKLARPDTVAISGVTRRLVEGLFELEALGPQTLKGVSEPVEVFTVIAEGEAPSRFEARAARSLTPIVGREEELALLRRRWQLAKGGESQVVLLSAEAGVGKSRLLRALRSEIEDESHSRILYFGSAYHQNSAFHVATDQFRRGLRFRRDETDSQQLDKLEAALEELGMAVDEHASVLAHFLSLPIGNRYSALEVSPAELKTKAFASSVEMFRAMAAQRPVLMAVEDAHWIDPSTLELISLAIEQLNDSPILFLITYRPDFEPPKEWRGNVVSLTLGRLSRNETARLITATAGGASLPRPVTDQIVARADGVPLFVEELTKAVIETGVVEETPDGFQSCGAAQQQAIPETLQDSLTARLDRLAPVKEVAQLAATIGRNFNRELLAAVSPLADEALDEALGSLVAADIIQPRGVPLGTSYEFKHGLVRDAAYQSLLKARRRQFHSRVANAIREHFRDFAEAEPELLAHHFTEAGALEEGIEYWKLAGKLAARRSAVLEAASHLTKALGLIESIQHRKKYAEEELDICLSLGPAVMATMGIASIEAERAYLRAQEISRELGDDKSLFTATWSLWLLNEQRMKTDRAHDLASEALEIAGRLGESEFMIEANHCAWTSELSKGVVKSCLDHCEVGIESYRPEEHRELALRYGGHDPYVCALGHSSLALMFLGYPDRAMERIAKSLEAAHDLAHVPSEIVAKLVDAMIQVYVRAPSAALEAGEELRARCEELGNRGYAALGNLMAGWGRVLSGGGEQAVIDMGDALAEFEATGARLRRSKYLTMLAEALLWLGDRTEGLRRVDEAVQFQKETGDRGWAAYTHQVRGDLLALGPRNDLRAAELSLHRAIEIAREQETKFFELRATTSLSRLWRDQGKTEEARSRLGSIYGWFTEGFDRSDLMDAKALLDELS